MRRVSSLGILDFNGSWLNSLAIDKRRGSPGGPGPHRTENSVICPRNSKRIHDCKNVNGNRHAQRAWRLSPFKSSVTFLRRNDTTIWTLRNAWGITPHLKAFSKQPSSDTRIIVLHSSYSFVLFRATCLFLILVEKPPICKYNSSWSALQLCIHHCKIVKGNRHAQRAWR